MQYLFFSPIPYPELVVRYINLFFLLNSLHKVFMEPRLVLTASFLNLAHKGAPTNAAKGIINSLILKSFFISFGLRMSSELA